MTDITAQRINIQAEETDYRSAVSEGTMTRMGAAVNFINTRQYDTHAFHLNGLYKKGVSVVGSDGIFPVLFDMEIVGITMWNRRNGTSGNTTLDVQWLSAPGVNEGTIFSAKPSFNNNVGNSAYMIKDFLSDTVVVEPALGATDPVLSKSQFDAGDALLLVIDSAMVGAEDCSLLIHFRPR
jgi:hypothetical protein